MKEKTSITLSKEVIGEIDRMAGSDQSRSAFIEAALRKYMVDRARAERDKRELELINRNVSQLNRDALDTLDYQAPVVDSPED